MSKKFNDSRGNHFRERCNGRLTPPSSPGYSNTFNSDFNMNNNRGYYESWPYEYSTDAHVPHSVQHGNNVNSRENERGGRRFFHDTHEENRWVNESFEQESEEGRPYYDPFEPLPISSPILSGRNGTNSYLNNERNLDLGTMSNFLDNSLAQERVDQVDEALSGRPNFHHKRPRANSNASNTGNSLRFQAPKSRRKRPKGMPKRPLSAYNLFFQSERAKIIAAATKASDANSKDDECTSTKACHASTKQSGCEDCDNSLVESDTNNCNDKIDKKDKSGKRTCTKSRKTPHGKISFEELGRLIGSRWKELSDEEKKQYQDTAAEESNRYSLEMEKFHKKRNENLKSHQTGNKKERTLRVVNEKQNKPISQATKTASPISHKSEANCFPTSTDVQKDPNPHKKSIDIQEASGAWTKSTESPWNKPISVTLNDSNGNLKEYYLAYAAVQMSKECAMKYVSTLSALGDTLNLKSTTPQSNEKSETEACEKTEKKNEL